jgi:flagellar basal body rod protein FlgG
MKLIQNQRDWTQQKHSNYNVWHESKPKKVEQLQQNILDKSNVQQIQIIINMKLNCVKW